MKPYHWLTLSCAIIAVADIVSLFLFFGGYVSALVPVYLIEFSALCFIIAGVRTMTIYHIKTDTGRSFLFMSLGGLVGFFGELHNFLTLYAGEGVKPVGIDDYFYTPALLCLAVGFSYAVKANRMSWTRKKMIVAAAWSAILILLLAVVFKAAAGEDIDIVGVSASYTIFASFLSLAALRVLMSAWEYRGGLIFKAWFGIFLGICLLIATVFALFLTIGNAGLNHNLSYIPLSILAAAEICFAYGITELGTITQNIQQRILTQQ